eukprot:Lankesteria_metandrocarpae@DN2162_c0_g1_i1.p1
MPDATTGPTNIKLYVPLGPSACWSRLFTELSVVLYRMVGTEISQHVRRRALGSLLALCKIALLRDVVAMHTAVFNKMCGSHYTAGDDLPSESLRRCIGTSQAMHVVCDLMFIEFLFWRSSTSMQSSLSELRRLREAIESNCIGDLVDRVVYVDVLRCLAEQAGDESYLGYELFMSDMGRDTGTPLRTCAKVLRRTNSPSGGVYRLRIRPVVPRLTLLPVSASTVFSLDEVTTAPNNNILRANGGRVEGVMLGQVHHHHSGGEEESGFGFAGGAKFLAFGRGAVEAGMGAVEAGMGAVEAGMGAVEAASLHGGAGAGHLTTAALAAATGIAASWKDVWTQRLPTGAPFVAEAVGATNKMNEHNRETFI